jgi:hypothetical protein
LLREPRRFFSGRFHALSAKAALTALLMSGAFGALAGVVTRMSPRPFVLGGILLINAVGTAVIAAVVGYTATVLITREKMAFRRVFGVFALSSAVILLFSWVPHLIVVTEPWRWLLIGFGLRHACGLKIWQTLAVVIVTVASIYMLFCSALPLMAADTV